tara:strand:+ start:20545 stop:20787 length:243 start_codon:yes stop_codon:yes gene_type:complete
MRTINISLTDPLKTFVDQQVAERGYSGVSEYVSELIEKDLAVQRLRGLLLEGARSAPMGVVDATYFAELRARVRCRDVTG